MTPEQLRTSILQYAMEGKLVKQDSNDEPASELVKRSQDKKIELIKNGELKKSKKLPVITDGEKPFNIPDNWAWSRLGDLFTILRGGSPRPIKSFLTNDENGINWIKIGDTNPNSKYITKTEEKIIPEGLKKSRAVHIGDFVLSNSMSFGRPYILKINGAVHDGWLIISDYDQVFNKDFLYYLLLSSFVKKQFSIAATGSTVKNLNRERVANTIGVIPPLEEQKRIVAKIEKLMPLVDEYAESYNRLQKIDNEFEDKLKQSVLQYAMEGKLVKQNLSDEPASELVKKIENKKTELIKEGKIRKSKKLPAINDDEKPFDIPDSWEWVRLKQITTYGNFNSIKGSSIPDNSWVVDMKDVRKNGGGFSEIVRRKSTDIYKSNKYSFNKNAVLYGKLRPYLRKVEIAQTSGFTTTEMLPINVVDLSTLVPQYLRYAMLSPYFVNLVNDSMYGMKMPRVGTTFLAKMVVPLPPLEEQKRIVEKVEELQSSISNLSK